MAFSKKSYGLQEIGQFGGGCGRVVVLEALELALFGLAGSCCKGGKAHREGSYSQNLRGEVDSSSFLASLGLRLNFDSRDESGEGCDGARRRIAPRHSFKILRGNWIEGSF